MNAADPGLLRGAGPGLGPLARRFPFEERTLLHVLAAQVRERPDQDEDAAAYAVTPSWASTR